MTVLTQRLWFPNPEFPGGADADGLVAVGGDLSPERLLLAYRSGIFPWSDRPITWWSPDPRGILELEQFHVSRSLRSVLKKRLFEVSMNRAFEAVMAECAASGPGRRQTWISRGFRRAYAELHRQGWAHSIECWKEGVLVGGVYGVAVGGLFAGESMFYRVDNASKVALAALVAFLRAGGCSLFDLQMITPLTQAMGATAIPRSEYLRRLAAALAQPGCAWPGC